MTTLNNYESRIASKTEPMEGNSSNGVEIIEERRKDADGRVLVYKYAKGKLLGKGGFAKCYVATTLSSSKTNYAIKIVNKATLTKPRAKQKLQTEIKIHKTLMHHNVVRFEKFFEDQENAFILLELCANNAMSDLIRRRKRLTEPESRFYIIQLLDALKYLHAECVIHRDLKLGNIFLDNNMHIKVGDFGLATRVTHIDERKRTICGTPNYIAPEILEGKTGHSYEVDIWSTGVVLYTFLIGKPPYESTDVKSTYKRILANSYSFPETVNVSEDSKNLIRTILQTRPEKRPSIDEIRQHSFFTRSTSFTPYVLPESSLREIPFFGEMATAETGTTTYVDKYSTGLTSHVGNENDPSEANRKQQQQFDSRVPLLGKPVVKLSDNGNGNGNGNAVLNHYQSSGSGSNGGIHIPKPVKVDGTGTAVTTTGGSEKWQLPLHNIDTAAAAASRSSATTTATSTHIRPALSVPTLRSASQQQQISGPRLSSVAPERSYGQQFDIFNDNKSKAVPVRKDALVTPLAQAHAPADRMPSRAKATPVADIHSARPTSRAGRLHEQLTTKTRLSDGGGVPPSSSSSSNTSSTDPSKKPTASSGAAVLGKPQDVDVLQTELELVNFEHRNMASQHAVTVAATTEHVAGAVPRPLAWSSTATSTATDGAPRKALTSAFHPPHSALDNNADHMDMDDFYNFETDENAGDNKMNITPPFNNAGRNVREMGTLETMHDVLIRSFAANIAEQEHHQQQHLQQQHPVHRVDLGDQTAKVWVVRYVDYTSKYGLGFLLNNGSAGVYFNDSTKIVQSPDGVIFQYVERRKKNGSENTAQMYLMHAFPPELQKKVTLLRHFRNYLLDAEQRKVQGLMAHDTGAGAGPTIESFGKHQDIVPNTALFAEQGQGQGQYDASSNLPYLKKWVRTRHAILFRLSNQCVQVVFFDQSEVLLSAEARVVTYVSKNGARSDHTLDDVLQTGRYDIAKRLKYTKDIMYRLISMPAK